MCARAGWFVSALMSRVRAILKAALRGDDRADPRPELRRRIAATPLAGSGYRMLADTYAEGGELFTAIALYRTARSLGDDGRGTALRLARSYFEVGLAGLARQEVGLVSARSDGATEDEEIEQLARAVQHSVDTWRLECLGYGKYQRMRIVADRIAERWDEPIRLADIGGGRGEFSLFVPTHRYVLVEPSVTGVGLPKLPFGDGALDVVVCSDVLEHVPKHEREDHILEMVRVARSRVYLTAPYGIENREFEELFYRLTQNRWTEEHLEHEVTTLDEMAAFLDRLGVRFQRHPCSFAPVHLAMGYLNNHWLRGHPTRLRELNEFVNSRYSNECRREPSYGYLFELHVAE